MTRSTVWVLLPAAIFIIGSFVFLSGTLPQLAAAEEFEARGVLLVGAPGYRVGLSHLLQRQDAAPYITVSELVMVPRSICEFSEIRTVCQNIAFENGATVVVRGRLYKDRIVVDELLVE